MPTYQYAQNLVAEVVVNHGHYRIRYGKIGAKELDGEVGIISVKTDIDNIARGIHQILAELTNVSASAITLLSNLPDADKDVLDHKSPLGMHLTLES